jgi:hypothetical protein
MKNRTAPDAGALRIEALHRHKAWNHGRRFGTLLLGAALSVGGVTEAFDGVRLAAEQSRPGRVVGQGGDLEQVRVLPDRSMSRELRLFGSGWVPQGNDRVGERKLTVINAAVRRKFFEASIPFGTLIHEKSLKYEVDPVLVAAVMETESSFQTDARSEMGAQGLMQLMPSTGRWLGAKDLYDPDQNVEAGAKYLSYLSKRFDGNLKKTIAAYNAGEGAVERYHGIPPYRETRDYVSRVLNSYRQRHKQMKKYGRPGGDSAGLQPDQLLAVR